MKSGHPIRILHLTAPARAGGLETVIQSLIPAQVERGDAVALAAVVTPGDEAARLLFNPLRGLNVRLEEVELPARAYVAEARRIAHLAREHRTTVLHTHGHRSDFIGALVGAWLQIPRVSTVHGFVGGSSRGRLNEWLQRMALRRFEAVVAVSSPLVDVLRESGVQRGRIHLVRNAWQNPADVLARAEARGVLGLASEGFHVGWVGRLSREKAPELAIEAVAALDDLPIVLSLVGDGPLLDELREMARALDLENVRFHGVVEGAGRLMSAFDVLLLSSHTEGTPMVLFEAMARDVPIVATRVGGVPDVLTGVAELVDAGSASALADGIRRVKERPAEARQHARDARVRLETVFASAPWAERYDEIYRAVGG